MSKVFKSRDPVLDRLVAIKVLTPAEGMNPTLSSRFLREAQTASNISHRNIVEIYGFGEEAGKLYIVMEFLSGKTIRSLIPQNSMNLPRKLHIALQLAQALKFIHALNIIHRDVKPENVNVDQDGRVKLMDFGIAKTQGPLLTTPGYILGTPYYMAPEQVKGKPVTSSVDIYAFGITMYEFFSGINPPVCDTIETIFYKILNEPLDLSVLTTAEIPVEIISMLDRCTKKDPEDRYATFDEVISVLNRVLGAPEASSCRPAETAEADSGPAKSRASRNLRVMVATAADRLLPTYWAACKAAAQRARSYTDLPAWRRHMQVFRTPLVARRRHIAIVLPVLTGFIFWSLRTTETIPRVTAASVQKTALANQFLPAKTEPPDQTQTDRIPAPATGNAPALAILPASIFFTVSIDSTTMPGPRTFTVSDPVGMAKSFAVRSSNAGWLNVVLLNSGTGTALFSIEVRPSNLGIGVYCGALDIVAGEQTSPSGRAHSTLPVCLKVTARELGMIARKPSLHLPQMPVIFEAPVVLAVMPAINPSPEPILTPIPPPPAQAQHFHSFGRRSLGTVSVTGNTATFIEPTGGHRWEGPLRAVTVDACVPDAAECYITVRISSSGRREKLAINVSWVLQLRAYLDQSGVAAESARPGHK